MVHSPSHRSTRMFKTFMQGALLLCSCALVQPGQAADDAARPVDDLVQRFTAAQSNMDAAALKALTADDYIEISPLGEVDPRDKMLSFYTEKRPSPAATVDDVTTRMLGDTAIVIARISYTRVVDGQTQQRSLRSTFVAEKRNGAWKLVSAHYTPIRPHTPG